MPAHIYPASPGAGPSTPPAEHHHPHTFRRIRDSIRNATGTSRTRNAEHSFPVATLSPVAANQPNAHTRADRKRTESCTPQEGREDKRDRGVFAGLGLRRLPSNLALRWQRDSSQPPPAPPEPEPPSAADAAKSVSKGKQRVHPRDDAPPPVPPSPTQKTPGKASFVTPALSQASLSSPALHQSSQAIPSPRSRPAERVSNDNAGALISPVRQKEKPGQISPPSPLTARRERERGNSVSPTPPPRSTPRTARNKLTSPSTPSLPSPPTSPAQLAPSSPESSPTAARHRSRPPPLQYPQSASAPHRAQSPPGPSSPTVPSTPTKSRARSPTSSTPGKDPSTQQSRPPLSPSAGLRKMGAGARSVSHLPLDGHDRDRPLDRSDRSRDQSDRHGMEKEKRRPSHGTSNVGPHVTSGSVSPEPSTPTRAPHAAGSRPRSTSPTVHRDRDATRGRDRDRERERIQSASPPPLQQHHRHKASSSTTSLPPAAPAKTLRRELSPTSTPASPAQASSPFRDTLRHAASLLVRELAGPRPRVAAQASPPSTASPASPFPFPDPGAISPEVWDECELRLRALVRAERVWGSSAGRFGSSVGNLSTIMNGSTASVSTVGATGGGGMTMRMGGEDRERTAFAEAVRDGYVMCQLVNKFRPGTIARIDAREDGFVRTSNVTKFLAAATTLGVPAVDIFRRDDLIECTPDGLHRVARTIVAVVRITGDTAPAAKVLHGQGRKELTTSPYGTRSKASASTSTPNLSLSVPVSTSPTTKKRWSPPVPGLPTVRGGSSTEDSASEKALSHAASTPAVRGAWSQHGDSALASDSETSDGEDVFFDLDPVPERAPAPAPILRTPTSRAPAPEAITVRASVATQSSQQTDATTFSSLLGVNGSSGARSTAYGTMRTVDTGASSFGTSEPPSFSASLFVTPSEDGGVKWRGALDGQYGGAGNVLKVAVSSGMRERRPSESTGVDLTRVAEETEEGSATGCSAAGKEDTAANDECARARPIQLGKGKWPDDFINAFQASKQSPLIAVKKRDEEQSVRAASPLASSPRKPSLIGATRPDESAEPSLTHLIPRRPTHRPRHSVDSPGLLPKDVAILREQSPSPGPEGLPATSRVAPLRRNSTKTGARNGMYIPRGDSHSPPPDMTGRVPFPRATSGEHVISGSAPDPQVLSGLPGRFQRGRFQSDVDGLARRKPRPNSYDEFGAKPMRSRIESMANLGGGSSNASASDLLSRDSMDGSAVRQTLIVRDDGKAPTHFQLGNCIGRGQFGSVYRALNLNTGQMVAVKRIRLEGLSEEEVKQLMGEVDLVKRLSHPSIVKYEGMSRDSDTLNIVLEYAENGSLGQTLKSFGKFNERLVSTYVVKILEGLDYLHRSDIVHCDLKAANILTTKNGNVKLSDFGVSLNLRQVEREIRNDVAGTPNWMAPEVIELKGASTASDIWSLACTVIELLTGKPPYSDIGNGMSVMFRIVEDEMPPIPEEFSDSLKDFLMLCFQKEPSKRPSAEMLCEHEWLKKNWGLHKELRPQDSIPFLRRVSADLQKSDAVRYLAQLEVPKADSPGLEHPFRVEDLSSSPTAMQGLPGSPPRKRLSNGLASPSIAENEMNLPREHNFVKTSFSKPVTCRVCMQTIKKTAVLCDECSLIAHSRCAPNAPPTCEMRSQLLQYAQYSNGLPLSPWEIIAAHQQFTSPTSPTNDSTPSTPDGYPPTAFKMLGANYRRSSLSPEPPSSRANSRNSVKDDPPQPPPSPGTGSQLHERPRKPTLLHRSRDARPRPTSLSSAGASTPPTSSVRSGATVGEDSISSHTGARAGTMWHPDMGHATYRHSHSHFSTTTGDRSAFASPSSVGADYDSVPGALGEDDVVTVDKRKPKKRDSSSNNGCFVQ